ncbi:MAG: panthothenate synthetase [Proteobacteria bacterium]|jgi:hypothetical protein|nr:panthothenate synthetase [Pseudomonadota bacterium]
MKFVMRVSLPIHKFNQAIADGTIGEKMRRILDETKPEAVYFTAEDGKRGGILIVDMKDVSEMPKFAEPWFLLFDAQVSLLPAMTPQDFQRAGLDAIAAKWR